MKEQHQEDRAAKREGIGRWERLKRARRSLRENPINQFDRKTLTVGWNFFARLLLFHLPLYSISLLPQVTDSRLSQFLPGSLQLALGAFLIVYIFWSFGSAERWRRSDSVFPPLLQVPHVIKEGFSLWWRAAARLVFFVPIFLLFGLLAGLSGLPHQATLVVGATLWIVAVILATGFAVRFWERTLTFGSRVPLTEKGPVTRDRLGAAVGIVAVSAVWAFAIANWASAIRSMPTPTPEPTPAPEVLRRQAPRNETPGFPVLRVTDGSGNVQTIRDADWSSFESAWMPPGRYIELLLHGSPSHRLWVHYSVVATVNLRLIVNELVTEVTLETGEVLSGTIPDPSMEIAGVGDFGRMRYAIRELNAIDVIGCRFPGSSTIEQRSECAEMWSASRPTGASWTVRDGESAGERQGLKVRDCYSQRRGNRAQNQTGFIEVRDGTAVLTVDLNEMDEFTLTGRMLGDGPEIRLTNRDGKTQTFTWLPRVADSTAGDVRGPLNEDDMLVWHTHFGWQGVSLVPLRPIMVTRR